MFSSKRLFFVVIVLAIVLGSGYFWRVYENEKRVYQDLQIKIDAFVLELKEMRLGLYRSSIQVNNDSLSKSVTQVKAKFSDLKQSVAQTDEYALQCMLDEEVAHVYDYTKAIQKYQSAHAIIKNSVSYLKNIYYEELSSHQTMIQDESLLLIDKILLGYYADDMQVQALNFEVLKKEKNPLLLLHVKQILKQYKKIKKIKVLLLEIEKRSYETLHVLRVKAESIVLKVDETNRIIVIVLFASTTLLLLFALNAYVSLRRQNRRILVLQKELEQFFEAFNYSAIISKSDVNGNITYANDLFCKVSGYSREELIGQNHRIVRHPDMPKEVFSQLWAQISKGEHFHAILKNKNKKGHPYYVDTYISPIYDVDGSIIEYIAVRYDVTELVHARDEAISAHQSKDEFFASMSHELRTPLNAIVGFSELLRKKLQGSEHKVHVDNIAQSSKLLLHLINDILDLAKIKSGKFTISKEAFSLKKEIEKMFERFKPQAQKAGITLGYICSCDEKINLYADWIRISQVYTNILSNALKFTPEGGKIECYITYKEGILEATFRDTGIGMDDKAIKNIFSAYVQGDSSTTKKYGGTGLGLSISKDLIEMMDGRLDVISAPEKGSTFSVILPVPTASTEHVQVEQSTRDEHFEGHLLVAEDNKTNQLLISMMLEEYGLSCDIVENGEMCIEQYEPDKYKLVLMDVDMPVMGGIEAMKALHEKYEKMVPIIALTANVMRGDKERFLQEGMDDFIAKPIEEADLKRVLSHYLA